MPLGLLSVIMNTMKLPRNFTPFSLTKLLQSFPQKNRRVLLLIMKSRGYRFVRYFPNWIIIDRSNWMSSFAIKKQIVSPDGKNKVNLLWRLD